MTRLRGLRRSGCVRRRGAAGSEDAFTLLELLLVAGILVLMTAVLVPRMSGAYHTLRLRATLQDIAGVVSAAAEYSIRYRVDTRLVVDGKEGAFWVEYDDPNQGVVSFRKVDTTILGEKQHLPSGMKIGVQEGVKVPVEGGNSIVRFLPNGQRIPAVFEITDRKGKGGLVTIGPLVGDLEVSR